MGGRLGLNGCRKDLCLFCVGLTPEWDQQMVNMKYNMKNLLPTRTI